MKTYSIEPHRFKVLKEFLNKESNPTICFDTFNGAHEDIVHISAQAREFSLREFRFTKSNNEEAEFLPYINTVFYVGGTHIFFRIELTNLKYFVDCYNTVLDLDGWNTHRQELMKEYQTIGKALMQMGYTNV